MRHTTTLDALRCPQCAARINAAAIARLGRRSYAEICASSRFGWYSARCARREGFSVYQRPGEAGATQLILVTAVSKSPEVYRDWGDEIFVGVVYLYDFVRACKAVRDDEGAIPGQPDE